MLKSSEYNLEKKCHLRRSLVTVIDPVTFFWTLKKSISIILQPSGVLRTFPEPIVTTNLATKNMSQRLKKNIRLPCSILMVTKPKRWINKINLLPYFLIAFPLQHRFFIAPVFLWFLFLVLFGVRGGSKLLIHLLRHQLRNRPWFSGRDTGDSNGCHWCWADI